MDSKDILKKVRKIEIKSRGLSNQIFSGHYHSAFKGRGMAFSEVREYQIGDDVRFIDWNVSARLNHPYVKVFEEERELTVMLLIDFSNSNEFGSQTAFKSDIITEIASILAFSAISNNDKVGVILFTDIIEKFIPPAKGSKHILRIIHELLNFKPQNKGTHIEGALKYLSQVIKKRSTVFLISDFMDSRYKKALQIANRKHDLAALKISDPLEREITNVGLIRVVDSERQIEKWIDTSLSSVRKSYAKWWQNENLRCQEIFKSSGVDWVEIDTSMDYVKPLIKLFKMRENRY